LQLHPPGAKGFSENNQMLVTTFKRMFVFFRFFSNNFFECSRLFNVLEGGNAFFLGGMVCILEIFFEFSFAVFWAGAS